jgi:hypothetical protein
MDGGECGLGFSQGNNSTILDIQGAENLGNIRGEGDILFRIDDGQ